MKPGCLSVSFAPSMPVQDSDRTPLTVRFSSGHYERLVHFKSAGAPLTASGDALLCLGLLPALELGVDLRIDCEVDEDLMEQSGDIQELLCAWYPGYQPVSILAKTTRRQYPANRKTGLFFSGGVDSCFSLVESGEKLGGLVTVIGADVNPNDKENAERLEAITRDIAGHYELNAIFVSTDIRRTSDALIGWVEYHGAVLAAIRHMLADEFDNQLIASSADESSWNRRWGSHPALDGLWSTPGAGIEHHGMVDRLAKIDRLGREPELMRRLRVCNLQFENCGACDKCLFMQASFDLLDIRNSATTFDAAAPATPDLRVTGEGSLSDLKQMRKFALAKGGHGDIVASIDKGLRRYERTKGLQRLVPVSEIKRRFKRLKRKMRFRRARTGTSG
ncbi:hypothetical protein [Hoeflea prorocentri]|uniref:Uncharacterized protein n=1 Tax=Hoeflea prorocentri TaxID=1922333 RepID=A0A9X3UMR0_9HYPH|nr:hypothetical protein [Hoeflea prorocentri]MCY6383469.1 hypothetical protein [Hoeflea prorocentri]MDA5401269.1 hypothetical protein [Hoeflea prorocentri]